jgi:hypothetical protein
MGGGHSERVPPHHGIKGTIHLAFSLIEHHSTCSSLGVSAPMYSRHPLWTGIMTGLYTETRTSYENLDRHFVDWSLQNPINVSGRRQPMSHLEHEKDDDLNLREPSPTPPICSARPPAGDHADATCNTHNTQKLLPPACDVLLTHPHHRDTNTTSLIAHEVRAASINFNNSTDHMPPRSCSQTRKSYN